MAFRGRTGLPGGDQGYARVGSDFQYGGSGSGMGVMAGGTSQLGQGIGSVGSMGGAWEPSVLYLFGLIVGEMILFHILSRVLK